MDRVYRDMVRKRGELERNERSMARNLDVECRKVEKCKGTE